MNVYELAQTRIEASLALEPYAEALFDHSDTFDYAEWLATASEQEILDFADNLLYPVTEGDEW